MALIDFKKIGKITKTYRHIGRYQEIVLTFLRHGFSDTFHQLGLDQTLTRGMAALHIGQNSQQEKTPLSRPERLRVVCEELGPSFIKMGQILSGRPEWLPPAYIKELEKLQDRVPPIPYDQVKESIEEELGGPIDSFFASFEKESLAAASIGQVHGAVLHDGTDVVVKVQRPDLKKSISVDLEIMHYFATLLEEHLDVGKQLEPTHLVDIFRKTIERELDFEWELAHLELFAKVFSKDPDLHVPQVHRDYSTKTILVMERIYGLRPDNPDKLIEAGHDLPLLAKKGARIIMEQVFVHGFYHADPHPGNIFILKDNRLCYVDYGMVGRISQRECEDLADLATSVVQKNERRAVKFILKLSRVKGSFNRVDLETQVKELFDLHLNMPIKNISIRHLLYQSIEILREHQIVIQPHFFLMLKALGSVEALGRKLDPNFQIVSHLKPFLRRVAINRYSPKNIQEQLLEFGEDFINMSRDLPREARGLLTKASKGELKIGFKHSGLESLNGTLDRISNRISFALIVSSLIIGSSLVVRANIPPIWRGMSLLGVGGYSLAAALGFFLVISMLRAKKF